MKLTAPVLLPSRSALRRVARISLPATMFALCDFDDTRPCPHWASNDDDMTRFAVAALLAASRRYFGLPERRR